ncbi:hypothetical protein [Roseovarius sp. MBR-51]
MEDINGNTTTLQNAQLQNLGFPTSFEFIGNTDVDTTPPELVSFSFPEVIDLGDGNAAATFSVSATDDVGVDSVIVWFTDDVAYGFSDTTSASNWSLLSIDVSEETGEGSVTRFFPAGWLANTGTAVIDRIVVEDINGNTTTLQNAQLQNLGFPTSFEFIGNTDVDTTPPANNFRLDGRLDGDVLSIMVLNTGLPMSAETFSATLNFIVEGATFVDVRLGGSGALSSSIQSLNNDIRINLTGSFADMVDTGASLITVNFSVNNSFDLASSDLSLLIEGQSQILVGLDESISNDAPTGRPVINGSAAEGQSLAATTIGVSDVDGLGTFSFQWLRNGAEIADANGETYNLTQSDVGSRVSVRVTYRDGFGATESVTSTQTAAVVNINDAPAGSVIVTGAATQGGMLTADTSAISDEDGLGTFSFQWLRNGAPILGATGTVLVLGQVDVGAEILARVSYTDGEGAIESLISSASLVAQRPGTEGNDVIVAGPLGSLIEGFDGNDTLIGGDGDDTIAGGDGDDNIEAGGGNDNVSASDGNDVVFGGSGNDNIGGGVGNDTIDGGEGDDIIGGGFGADSITGGAGNDVVAGGADNDTLSGGDGNDSMSGSFGSDLIDAGSGADDIGGGTGRDTIDAGEGNDRVGGGEGDDSILGGAGNDFLAGGGRDDTIDGGTGNDTINGGAGNDVMTGGADADQFVFSAFFDSESDVITDFEDGIDIFFIRRIDPDTGVENINNGGNGLAGFVAAMNIIDTDAGAQMSVNGNAILVEGITAAQLTVDDFSFL